MRNEVQIVVAIVETRLYEAISFSMDNLVVPRLELAMRRVVNSSTRNPGSVVLDADQRNFSPVTSGLQMTASIRFKQTINLNETDEIHGNFTVAESILFGLVRKRNPDRKKRANHNSHPLS